MDGFNFYPLAQKPKRISKTRKKEPKNNRRRFEFIMDEISDKDIIEMLDSQANKADYIRRLIRADIAD